MVDAADLLTGEFVRLKVERVIGFGAIVPIVDEPRFVFVRFIGEFDSQAVVEDANGVRKLVTFDDISAVKFCDG